jgi:hypothetical protein
MQARAVSYAVAVALALDVHYSKRELLIVTSSLTSTCSSNACSSAATTARALTSIWHQSDTWQRVHTYELRACMPKHCCLHMHCTVITAYHACALRQHCTGSNQDTGSASSKRPVRKSQFKRASFRESVSESQFQVLQVQQSQQQKQSS